MSMSLSLGQKWLRLNALQVHAMNLFGVFGIMASLVLNAGQCIYKNYNPRTRNRYSNPVLSMKCHTSCLDEVKHIDCLQMSAERLHREWTKEHPEIKVKGSGSIKKKHTPPEQKPLNVCFSLTLYSEHNTNIFLRITSQF